MRRIDRAGPGHGPADERTFVPPGLTQRLLGAGDDLPVRLYRVTFGPGGRTHWHAHDDIQVLFGIQGRCRVVNRAGEELLLNPGDVVVIDPGEEHWHGAAPGTDGEHLAINLGRQTTWLESSG